MPSSSRLFAATPAALAACLCLQAPTGEAQTRPARPGAPSAPAARAAAAPPATTSVCERVNIAPVVNIPVGKSTVVRPSTPVTRILLGNPDNARAARPVEQADPTKEDGQRRQGGGQQGNLRPGVADVDVVLLGPTEVYLLGKTVGSTNVVMLDRSGTCTAFDVVVGMDTMALQGVIQQLLPNERDVKVTPAFDSIVLTGTVSDAEALARVTDLAGAYVRGQDGGAGNGGRLNPRIVNMLEVGAPQQVMLEVKVAEVSKALLDQFGIDFSRAYVPGDRSMVRFLSGIFGGVTGVTGQISGTNNVPLSSVDVVVGGSVSGIGGNSNTTSTHTTGNVTVTLDPLGRPVYTTTYGTVPGRGVSNLNLNMQKTDGLVKVLAEPTVMAISGQTGSFLAGGKIFIPVATSDGGGGRTVTLDEKEFGVSVRFTPTVLGGGRINLRVRPEVSDLNPGGVTITGFGGTAVLPSFTSRKAETTVQLMDGQSFAIGGLIKNNTTANIRAFPFLGEIPVLGALFRSTEFQTDRSELVFVITPRLVKPLPPDYRLPTDGYVPPTRGDMIFQGRLEGTREAPAPDAPRPAAPAAAPRQGGFDTTTEKK